MADLLLLYLKNDKDKAYEYLYKKYRSKVFALCWKVLKDKNEVEDVMQEVFIKVFENIEKFHFRSSLDTWIYRVSLNHILNKNRKVDFHLEFNEKVFISKTEEHLELKEIDEEISKALAKLKIEDKKVFILREYEGLSYKKIAKILDLKEGTVKSKLYYVKQKLRLLLKTYVSE